MNVYSRQQPLHFDYEKKIKELRELNAELMASLQQIHSCIRGALSIEKDPIYLMVEVFAKEGLAKAGKLK